MSDDSRQTQVKALVDGMLSVLDNIDSMFDDLRAAIEKDFAPLHNGYSCDLSRQSAGSLFPNCVAEYFGRNESSEGSSGLTLGVAVLLTDHDFRPIEPLLAGGVLKPRDAGTPYVSWWVHSAVLVADLEDLPLPDVALGVALSGKRGYHRSKANYWFEKACMFTVPLTEITTPDILNERFVKPLVDLYDVIGSTW